MAQKAGLKKAAKIKIGVLYGGRSGEHDVSLCSAASVFSALDRNKYEVTAIGIAQRRPLVCAGQAANNSR